MTPLERMIERIRIVSKKPMALISEEEIEKAGALNMIKKEAKTSHEKKKKQQEDNETYYLEQSLFTIGRLLGICYGQAGAKIVGDNIATAETGGDFNPLMFGELIYGMYGYCKVRKFGELCENLNTNAMVYINMIADVVHTQVDVCFGVANKNLGDKFMLIWRIPEFEEDTIVDASDIADLALMSALKVYAKVNSFEHIHENTKKAACYPND